MKNFTEYIKKHKLVFIFISIVLIILLSGCLYFFNKPQKPIPTSTTSLKLLKSIPYSGSTLPLSTTAIGFMFSVPINEDLLNVNIEPKTSIRVIEEDEGATIYIRPQSVWKKDVQYKLVLSNIKSKTGQELNSDIQYSFIVKNPEFVEEID